MYIIYNHIIRRFDFSFQNNQKRKIHFDTNSSKSLLKDTDISNDRPCFFRCGKFGFSSSCRGIFIGKLR